MKKRPITEEAHLPRQPLSRVFRFRLSIFCLFGSSPWDISRSLKSAKSMSREVRGQCDIMGAVRDDCFSPVAVISISPSDVSESMGPGTPALFLSLTWGVGRRGIPISWAYSFFQIRDKGDNNRAVRTEKDFIICFQEHCSAMGPRERMSH